MRLDKYLKVSRVIKRRTLANEVADAGRVLVNGKPAKASYTVKIGDIIEVTFGNRPVKIRVLSDVEQKGKDVAREMFGVIEGKRPGALPRTAGSTFPSACIHYHCKQAGGGTAMPETKLESRTPPRAADHHPAEATASAEGPPPLAVTGVIRVISCDRKRRCALETPLSNLTRRRAGAADRRAFHPRAARCSFPVEIEYPARYAENQQSGGSLLARLFR